MSPYLSLGSYDSTVCIWEVETGKLLQTLDGPADGETLFVKLFLLLTLSSRFLFSLFPSQPLSGYAGTPKETYYWQVLVTCQPGCGMHPALTWMCACSPHTKALSLAAPSLPMVSSSALACTRGKLLRRSLSAGKLVLTGSEDGTVRVWDPKSAVTSVLFEGLLAVVIAVERRLTLQT